MANGHWFDAEALHAAAQRGDVDEVGRLLADAYDVNLFDDLGKTPLHYAAQGEHLDVARLLINWGADVNAHNEACIGDTPLADIAAQCSLAMAQLLIGAGADPTIPGWMQLTAMHRAMKRKRGDGPAVYALMLEAVRQRLNPSVTNTLTRSTLLASPSHRSARRHKRATLSTIHRK